MGNEMCNSWIERRRLPARISPSSPMKNLARALPCLAPLLISLSTSGCSSGQTGDPGLGDDAVGQADDRGAPPAATGEPDQGCDPYACDCGFGTASSGAQASCVGSPLCNVDEECPAARSGSVDPICQSNGDLVLNGSSGSCILPCLEPSVCPDGMACIGSRCQFGQPSFAAPSGSVDGPAMMGGTASNGTASTPVDSGEPDGSSAAQGDAGALADGELPLICDLSRSAGHAYFEVCPSALVCCTCGCGSDSDSCLNEQACPAPEGPECGSGLCPLGMVCCDATMTLCARTVEECPAMD